MQQVKSVSKPGLKEPVFTKIKQDTQGTGMSAPFRYFNPAYRVGTVASGQ